MNQIVIFAELKRIVRDLKRRNKKIVFTNGCFDLLNYNHIKYLQYSKDLGDVLIVAVNDDQSMKRLKNDGRPLINQRERLEMLASLKSVDYAVLFEKKIDFLRLIEMVQPDFYTKGGDYENKQVRDIGFCEMHSGKVVIAPRYTGFSTTDLIKKILKHYGKEKKDNT